MNTSNQARKLALNGEMAQQLRMHACSEENLSSILSTMLVTWPLPVTLTLGNSMPFQKQWKLANGEGFLRVPVLLDNHEHW